VEKHVLKTGRYGRNKNLRGKDPERKEQKKGSGSRGSAKGTKKRNNKANHKTNPEEEKISSEQGQPKLNQGASSETKSLRGQTQRAVVTIDLPPEKP